MVGCETAEFLAERGHEVAVVEMNDVIAADVTPENRRYMFENFREHHVSLHPGWKVKQFYQNGVDCEGKDGSAVSLRGFDHVVLAMGSKRNDSLREIATSLCPQVFVIGEAANVPGNALAAMRDAFEAAIQING